jgi:hypothetical protein
MPITPSFTVSQNTGDLPTLSILDTSTGSDASITTRRIYLIKHDGSYLKAPNSLLSYTVWSYGTTSISIPYILDKDYSLLVRVDYMASNTLVISKSELFTSTNYTSQFLLDLTRFQVSNQKLINNSNYFESKVKLRELLDDAIQAGLVGEQVLAQMSLNQANTIMSNSTLFY